MIITNYDCGININHDVFRVKLNGPHLLQGLIGLCRDIRNHAYDNPYPTGEYEGITLSLEPKDQDSIPKYHRDDVFHKCFNVDLRQCEIIHQVESIEDLQT